MERFFAKFMPEPNSGCWLWTASLNPGGYGQFAVESRMRLAHRVSYALFKGIIPQGWIVMHKCDVRSCVNPDHLTLGSHLDNAVDCIRKGRHRHSHSHCRHGHELTEKTVIYKTIRLCKACDDRRRKKRAV